MDQITCPSSARTSEASAASYEWVPAPLGGERVMQFDDVIAYGVAGQPTFWLGPLATGKPNREIHIAFAAPDREAVRAFFDAAVTAGAVLHEPREWPEYHAGYYGAFVRDPDGNNVEGVCHTAQLVSRGRSGTLPPQLGQSCTCSYRVGSLWGSSSETQRSLAWRSVSMRAQ